MAKVNTRKRGNYWEYQFEAAKSGGKRTKIQKSGFPTQKAALAAGTKALSEYNNSGFNFVPSEISFSDYLNLWFKEYCEINLKPETCKNYKKRIENHIRPAFGKFKLKSITAHALQAFINDIFNKGYSRTSLQNIKGILSRAFTYAVEPLGFIQHSPMIYVKLPAPRAKPKIETRSNPHTYIEQDLIDKIFERFPEETSTHIPMLFAYKCGTRLGESFAFVWEDIDFENSKISINRQVQWDEKIGLWYFSDPKYDSFRNIEIDKDLCELLKREFARQERDRQYYGDKYTKIYENDKRQLNTIGDGKEIHLVCVRQNGTYISPRCIHHTSQIIHHKMNFPDFDMHSLRVTHATMLAEKGAPPKFVQHRLGHKNIQVTLQIYTKLSNNISLQGKAILESLY